MTARCSLLAGLAVAGTAALPVAAVVLIGENDRRLLELDAQLRAAVVAEEATCKAKRETIAAHGQGAFDAAHADAFDAWEAVLDAMVNTPADGLPGVAVKAGAVCRALDTGAAEADHVVAESLVADLVRLLPGVAL